MRDGIMNGTVIAYNVIETTGLVGALAIIITAILSHSIQRLSTWYLVLISGAVYSFSKLLLAMAHAQFGPSPNSTLCLIQSSLIYSGPICQSCKGTLPALEDEIRLAQLFQWSSVNWCHGPADDIQLDFNSFCGSIVKSWKFWKYERPSLPRAGRAATSLEVHAATVESSLV
ncbi:hypothetical protein D9757_010576 [Collybiopsis confluens]|uniref:Uncharacterized protein n=1 Tax=Collybiopsis confluens TaxID=2823264 RepID=A0A8H5GW28_9AGAR|nr:hypothetical protein D9757_010576 [Collybiopsis confluens]